MKSKILLAVAGVFSLFSVCCEAAFFLSKEELRKMEVTGPCWFTELTYEFIFRNCGNEPRIKEIRVSPFRGGGSSFNVVFESEDASAKSELMERVKTYGMVFEERTGNTLYLGRTGNTLYLRGTAEQIRIIWSVINEMDPLSLEVLKQAERALSYGYVKDEGEREV